MAFVDPSRRAGWLPDVELSERTVSKPKTVRFDVGDGTSRLFVSIDAKGPEKSTVVVEHSKLVDADERVAPKMYWRQALATLKAGSSAMSELYEPRVLLDGLAYVESPRWRDSRLWFFHWAARRSSLSTSTGTARSPHRPAGYGLGHRMAARWTPARHGRDARAAGAGWFVRWHADLTGVTGLAGAYTGASDEIVVDGRGNIVRRAVLTYHNTNRSVLLDGPIVRV